MRSDRADRSWPGDALRSLMKSARSFPDTRSLSAPMTPSRSCRGSSASNQSTGRLIAPPSGHCPPGSIALIVAQNVNLEQFEISMPTLDEIFIRVVQGKERRHEQALAGGLA